MRFYGPLLLLAPAIRHLVRSLSKRETMASVSIRGINYVLFIVAA